MAENTMYISTVQPALMKC